MTIPIFDSFEFVCYVTTQQTISFADHPMKYDLMIEIYSRESLRYQAAALRLMKMVGESVENFGEPDEVSRTVQEIACADRDRDKDKVFPDIKVCYSQGKGCIILFFGVIPSMLVSR